MLHVQRLTYIFLNGMFIDMSLKTRVHSHKLTEVCIDSTETQVTYTTF